MKLSDFTYTLPKELIALEPVRERTGSKLLVVSRDRGTIEHKRFRDLLEYLNPGDALFLNDTRVIPARLEARRVSGGRVEILLLREIAPGSWEVLMKPSGRIKAGEKLEISPNFQATVFSPQHLEFHPKEKFWELVDLHGQMPLPPYIKRKVREEDKETYQTVFARHEGAIAAPTAGLHFDQDFLAKVEQKGVSIGWVTLHVGYGTFKPISHEDVREHTIHEEFYRVPEASVKLHEETRASGGRIFVCGTTTLRALETVKQADGNLQACEGRTSLFIYPPYSVTTADALITNFHLPRTTLLLLVSAFAGRELVLKAYETAVSERYRFYSYGDAMLIC